MAGILVAFGAVGTDWSRGWPPRPYKAQNPEFPWPRRMIFYLMLFVAPACVLLAIFEFARTEF